MSELQRHIHITKEQTCPVVLVMGDPNRVDFVKQLCDSYVDLAYNREYKSAQCTYKNQKFLCISHGVGSAGAAICFNELIDNGAKVIIRVGSCGSLQPDKIKRGDLCICHSAVREDRTSHLLVPADYPAVSDFEIYQELLKCAKESGIKTHTGISLTSDLYYPHNVLPTNLELYSKANVSVVEMEVATLFIIGMLKNVKTGGIFIVDGCPFKWDEGDIDVKLDQDQLKKMLLVSLETCARIAAQYNQ